MLLIGQHNFFKRKKASPEREALLFYSKLMFTSFQNLKLEAKHHPFYPAYCCFYYSLNK